MNQYIGIYRRRELLYIRCELEKYGLQPLEGKMLFFLSQNCCTQDEVSLHFAVDKGRIARAFSVLEEKGLVCRTVNEKNKRQKLATLTAQGEQIVTEIDGIFGSWDKICYAGFTEEERQLHHDFVKRIAGNAMEYRLRQGEGEYGK